MTLNYLEYTFIKIHTFIKKITVSLQHNHFKMLYIYKYLFYKIFSYTSCTYIIYFNIIYMDVDENGYTLMPIKTSLDQNCLVMMIN